MSGLGESAPTSLYRDRSGRDAKAKKVDPKGKGRRKLRMAEPSDRDAGVKAEPVSPVKRDVRLSDPNDGLLPPIGREDEGMMSSDEDVGGRRMRAFASVRGGREEVVNEAQRVDLSESESEEEEDSMEGDFVATPGSVRSSILLLETLMSSDCFMI